MLSSRRLPLKWLLLRASRRLCRKVSACFSLLRMIDSTSRSLSLYGCGSVWASAGLASAATNNSKANKFDPTRLFINRVLLFYRELARLGATANSQTAYRGPTRACLGFVRKEQSDLPQRKKAAKHSRQCWHSTCGRHHSTCGRHRELQRNQEDRTRKERSEGFPCTENKQSVARASRPWVCAWARITRARCACHFGRSQSSYG